MTRESLKLPGWLWPVVLAGLMGVGAARVTLAGKEDGPTHDADIAAVRKDHTADVVTLQNAIRAAETQRDLDFIRDSAWKADAMRILLDIQRKANR